MCAVLLLERELAFAGVLAKATPWTCSVPSNRVKGFEERGGKEKKAQSVMEE